MIVHLRTVMFLFFELVFHGLCVVELEQYALAVESKS